MGGWQPRPNVIFEAGVAVAAARDKTILVRIGSLRQISDLGGVLFVDLDAHNAKTELLRNLQQRVPGLPALSALPEELPGEFGDRRLRRYRWPYHDELGNLEHALRHIVVPGSRKSLLDALGEYVRYSRTPDAWTSGTLVEFIKTNVCRERTDDGKTNAVFWHLMVEGVLMFEDIDIDGKGWSHASNQLWWSNLMPYTLLTPRGWALLRKLLVLPPADKIGVERGRDENRGARPSPKARIRRGST